MWRAALVRAKAVVITTGAGMGVDSGLPDFRGVEGFWRAFPPFAERGLSLSQVSTPSWFGSDPSFAWGFFGHRYRLYSRTEPHSGFRELLAVAQSKPEGYFVVTSNVDGHFQKAGFDPKLVFEVHGSIHHWQCRLGCEGIWEAEGEIQVDETTFRAQEPLPRCPKCQAIARPNILMFGDAGFRCERREEQGARYGAFVERALAEEFPLMVLEIGLAVPTIRRESEHLLDLSPGAFLLRVNPRDPEIPERFKDRSHSFPMTSLDAIQLLRQIL